MSEKTVLVTGGAGFIGSHTCVELIEQGYRVVVADDLSNSSPKAITRIKEIVGEEKEDLISFYKLNITDKLSLCRVLKENPDIDSVIHFAGYKAVGESCKKPLAYYRNNLDATLSLCEAMKEYDITDIVFSSSATVYGDNKPPLTEQQEKRATFSPYGWTKWMIEQILFDIAASDPSWNAVLLRYFNPIGAHPSGLIGEDPKGIPNNLMPYIAQVAVGRRSEVHVFGDDYPTPDGTCRRDYLHVMDLADGHVKALQWMEGKSGVEVFNLGTGTPTSVYELIDAFGKACGHDIPYVIDPRREGDLPEFWADPSKAESILGWKSNYDISEMCRDSWNWQNHNPEGYATIDD